MMKRFGQHEIDPIGNSSDGYEVFLATQQPLLEMVASDPEGFVRELADTCVTVGGWAVFGADRTVTNLIDPVPPSPEWHSILDASIQFLRSNYVPPIRVSPYAWRRFIDSGGTAATWMDARPLPDRLSTPITPLQEDETRFVVRLTPDEGSNVILVRRKGNGYVALVDARYSDDDPTRSQSEWKHAPNLYNLYEDLGLSVQMWDWLEDEIKPFFRYPKALI